MGKQYSGSQKNKNEEERKTFTQLGEEVKNRFFRDNYSDLLNMSNASQLDVVLNTIENFVEQEGKSLSTSQLRNIYDKAIKCETQNELKLIRPNLAYLAGRSTNDREKSLLAFIYLLIKEVCNKTQVKEFKTFFEAVVAYHKFYGKQ